MHTIRFRAREQSNSEFLVLTRGILKITIKDTKIKECVEPQLVTMKPIR